MTEDMKPKIHYLKIVSSLLVGTFFVQDLSWAALDLKPSEFALFPKPLLSFNIPESVALIQDTYKGSGGRTLVLIQDAHTNSSAQKNIAKAINLVFQKEKPKYVFWRRALGTILCPRSENERRWPKEKRWPGRS